MGAGCYTGHWTLKVPATAIVHVHVASKQRQHVFALFYMYVAKTMYIKLAVFVAKCTCTKKIAPPGGGGDRGQAAEEGFWPRVPYL